MLTKQDNGQAVPCLTININILQYDRNRTVGKDDNLVMEQVY